MSKVLSSVDIIPLPDIWRDALSRIRTREAKVGIVGLGYVGLPLAVAFAGKGFTVQGFDVNERKVSELTSGSSYVADVDSFAIKDLVEQEKFAASSQWDALRTADAIIICVPTPCRRNREPDLSYIENAARGVSSILRPGQLVILESTTYPGTTEELLLPILEASGLKLGDDFLVAFSPERIDPGNKSFHVENTPKVVGGLGEVAGSLACELYGSVIEKIVPVASPRVAEMSKLIENTFRHVNIALANELAVIAHKMNIDIWQAIEAASSKPFGFMPFYPGPGVGGHCIPIDPHYLSWKAREMGCETSFIELATRINHSMPEYVVRLVVDAVNQAGTSIRGAKVLMLGLAYKPDIDDTRESPAYPILDLLFRHGADLSYHDPYVPTFRLGGEVTRSVELTSEVLAGSDCVVLVTDHSCFDLDMIVKSSRLIVDTRNRLRAYSGEHIVRL